MAAGWPRRRVVASKLVPPDLPELSIRRARLIEALDTGRRFTIVSALPGYGKTIAVHQFVTTLDEPVVWVSLDILDRDPFSFWAHVLTAMSVTLPGIDDEPLWLLEERGPDDPLFVSSLLVQVEQAGTTGVVVLDGVPHGLEQTTLDQLALIVERVGDRIRIFATARAALSLPLVKWRSVGWSAEIDTDELRFTDAEADELAARFERSDLGAVRDLNERVDGWPIALHVGLMTQPSSRDRHPVEPIGEHLAGHLVADVLNRSSPRERVVAESLSIADQFDPAFCADLLGPDAPGIVNGLVERGVFVTVVDPPTRTMRFHELFRSVLEADLRRRDRSRWIDLHRRAASLWSARGDLTAAYQHLAAVGDSDRAQQFFVQPALDLVDDGDVDALRQFVRSLPRLDDVADPYLALDLALVAFYASGPAAAKPWCDRAGGLIDALGSGTGPQSSEQDREALTLRLHDMTCAVALLDADLDTAIKCVDVHRQLAAPVRGHDRFEKRFPILAARVMLAARRRNEAETWIGRAERIDGPELVSNATVPTLRAWQGWLDGRLHTAASLSEGALAWLDEHHVGPHHFAFDTLITTGWCRLSAGDSGGAMTLAERARSDARVLACAWNELQSAYLWARVALAGGDLAGALGAVEELRATVDFDACRPYADRVLGLEIEVLFEQRRHEEATRLINRLQPGPRERVLRARSGTVGDDALGSFLADRAGWPATERIQADLLLATVGSEPAPSAALSALVRDCADTGWVHPFLGFGPRVDRLLLSDAVGRIHPALRAVVASRPAAAGERTSTASSIALTERERTLLELLPTHLSYSEIGERLFLSVNTVKSNMKVLYRKLDANTRTQAVDAAERAGLL